MIRVIVVDDSSFMRSALLHILRTDPSVECIDTAADGEEAVRKVMELRPDVVLLDIQMPVMDGLSALSRIMAECPTPVLMLSALKKKDATVAMKSLECGAVDFIAKPSGVISYDIDKLSGEIIDKVKAAAVVRVSKLKPRRPGPALQPVTSCRAGGKEIVVIGASTGGPRAVFEVLSGLGRDMPAGVLVVQHMAAEFIPSFVERLKWGCSLEVSLARKGEAIRPGRAMVAPGGCHTTIVRKGNTGRIRISRKASPGGVFPSVDYAMESAAWAYGSAAIGVLLTGMGRDGAMGIKAIKDAGGETIAEDESTSVIFGMPAAAIELGCVDEVVPLPMIARTIMKMV